MKKREYSKEQLAEMELMRHSASHLLAAAVIKYFEKEGGLVKLGIGPAIEDGFYYDFDLPRKLTTDELPEIEKLMEEIKEKADSYEQRMLKREDAINLLTERGQIYKVELANELEDKELSFYKSGEFEDLCRGPHVANTSKIGAFKLTSIAGAYWRGDEKRPMLTRIYGVAFPTQEELDEYLAWLEEVKSRDHRKIGKEMGLFTFSDLVGPGLPLFTQKGTILRNEIVKFIMSLQKEFDSQEVWIPHMTKKDLYEVSGHWQKFQNDLFHVRGKGDTEFVLKPMNCPHHTQIFASELRSYKDLPVRLVETTTCYRDELVGELHGISRVRSLTQDDGHTFCTLEQVKDEVKNLVGVIRSFYTALKMFGEDNYWVSLSVRDPRQSEKYLGNENNWKIAEKMLEEVANEERLNYRKVEGEAAFYGPKLDFMFKDSLGRENQLATIQVDFVMPERFKLEYTDEKGEKQMPIMIHRAIAGSIERFLSIMIEHFNGKFPLWLNPIQIKVIPITESHIDYARKVLTMLKNSGLRAELNDKKERMQAKIRDAQIEKVNYMLIVGNKEMEIGGVAVRNRNEQDLGLMKVEEFINRVQNEIENKE